MEHLKVFVQGGNDAITVTSGQSIIKPVNMQSNYLQILLVVKMCSCLLCRCNVM